MARNTENTNVTPFALDPSDDLTQLEVDASGNLKITGSVSATIPTPVPVTDNSGSLTVDGTVGVNNFPSVYPAAAGDAYSFAVVGSDLLITRASDSKVITIGNYQTLNGMTISDWT